MDVRNKIITILDAADIRFDILEDRNLKVFPNNATEYDFLCQLFRVVEPYRWYSSDLVEWFKDGTTYYDEYDGSEQHYHYPEYVVVEFE